jgi:hypothetical protein
LWDRFEFRGNPTLNDLVTWFKKNHNLDVNMVSQGVVMLWSPFAGKAKVSLIATYSGPTADRDARLLKG